MTRPPRLFLALALVVAALPAFSAPARAGYIELANFTTASGTPFTFTNNTTSASLGNGANVLHFAFSSATGLAHLSYDATVTFTGTTVTPASTSGGQFNQPINGVDNTITFKDVATGNTLLTVAYTGNLTGFLNGLTDNLLSSSTINNVTYSSPLLPGSFFNNPASFQLNLPTAVPASIGPGGFVSSYSSNFAQGEFFTSSPVPEPAAAALFALGALAAPFALRSARRTQAGLGRA